MAEIDFRVLGIAILGGVVPTLLWLWFWLKEDQKPEPRKLIILTFVIGMISVFVVLPFQRLVDRLFTDFDTLVIIWAGLEEIIKFLAVFVIALKSGHADEPVDFAIYMIIGALGFAAMENTLFLIDPIAARETTVGITTGNLRFLGATLLHAVSSGAIGIMLGLSFYKDWFMKKVFVAIGLFAAISLHGIFNFLIINTNGSLFKVFALLWGVTVIVLLLFERLRRMTSVYIRREPIK